MIDRQCHVFHTHLYTSAHGQFVGVDLRGEQVLGGRQDAVRIFHRKEAFVAEDVNEIGVFRSLRNQVDDRLHVLLMRVPASHGVGAQEGAFHRSRNAFADAADHAQHLDLIGRVKSVSALDFQGYGAFVHHLPHADHRLGKQFILRGLVQQVGRIEDAAAPGGDFLVAETVYLVQEFSVPAAGIHHVRMAVAETGHHHAAPRIQVSFNRTCSEIHDPAVLDGQPGVAQDAGPALLRAFHAQHALRLNARQQPYVIDNLHS